MEHYAGIEVSLELSSVCIVDAQGKIVREAKVASEPEALVAFFASLGFAVKRIGLEAGPLSQWLHSGLKRAGFDTVLLETRHVKAALSAMMVKTDRKDARGLAQLIRMGWFRPVHAKSMGSQEVRALLVARKQLLGRLIDVELSIRGILRGFGLKVGVVTRKGFEGRIRELVTGHITLERIAGAMLSARATLKVEYEKLHKIVLTIVREDAVCRRLMTALNTTGGTGTASLYLIANGGHNPQGSDNPAIALMTVIGDKPPATVTINEMTTVASVWTHAQFLDGSVIKGPALSLRIAAGNVPNFVDLQTGGWGGAIQDPLNTGQTPTMANFATLADVLAGCVTGATVDACPKLYTAATPPKGGAPNDTLTAAQSIARNPWYQPTRVFALIDQFYPIPKGKNLRAVPYMPYLNSAPSAWVLLLKFDGGG